MLNSQKVTVSPKRLVLNVNGTKIPLPPSPQQSTLKNIGGNIKWLVQ